MCECVLFKSTPVNVNDQHRLSNRLTFQNKKLQNTSQEGGATKHKKLIHKNQRKARTCKTSHRITKIGDDRHAAHTPSPSQFSQLLSRDNWGSSVLSILSTSPNMCVCMYVCDANSAYSIRKLVTGNNQLSYSCC